MKDLPPDDIVFEQPPDCDDWFPMDHNEYRDPLLLTGTHRKESCSNLTSPVNEKQPRHGKLKTLPASDTMGILEVKYIPDEDFYVEDISQRTGSFSVFRE